MLGMILLTIKVSMEISCNQGASLVTMEIDLWIILCFFIKGKGL